jgi:hypothetical protein
MQSEPDTAPVIRIATIAGDVVIPPTPVDWFVRHLKCMRMEMLYERERLIAEDATSLAARRETVTQPLEDSATVFGEGSPSNSRASL